MTLPTSEPILPNNESHLPPARRRRQQRLIVPEGAKRAVYLEELAHHASSSLDFFIFSFIGGLALSAALLLDTPAPFFLAVALFPFMSPLFGLSLATSVGSPRFFFQSLGSMALGSLLVFSGSFSAAWVSRFFVSAPAVQQAALHVSFSIWSLLVTAAATVAAVYSLARHPQQKPVLASLLLAYTVFAPLGIAGYNLAAGTVALAAAGLALFAVNLILSMAIASWAFFILGLHPQNTFGYALSGGLALLALIAVLLLASQSTSQQLTAQITTPSQTPESLTIIGDTPQPPLTETLSLPTTETPSPAPTQTPTQKLTHTSIPTWTMTPPPAGPTITVTPYTAVVAAREGNGAFLRSSPNSNAEQLRTVLNGSLLRVFEVIRNDNQDWARVQVVKGNHEGWMMWNLIATPTNTPVAK